MAWLCQNYEIMPSAITSARKTLPKQLAYSSGRARGTWQRALMSMYEYTDAVAVDDWTCQAFGSRPGGRDAFACAHCPAPTMYWTYVRAMANI